MRLARAALDGQRILIDNERREPDEAR